MARCIEMCYSPADDGIICEDCLKAIESHPHNAKVCLQIAAALRIMVALRCDNRMLEISAEHDRITIGDQDMEISDQDLAILERLGFTPSYEGCGWDTYV